MDINSSRAFNFILEAHGKSEHPLLFYLQSLGLTSPEEQGQSALYSLRLTDEGCHRLEELSKAFS